MVRVQHEDFCGFCFYFAEVIQITETGTHCEMNTVVVLKEGTPTEKKTSHQSGLYAGSLKLLFTTVHEVLGTCDETIDFRLFMVVGQTNVILAMSCLKMIIRV